MKNIISKLIQLITIFVCSTLPVYAASGAREDNSGILSYIFLGFCGLIVIAQLVPAILMLLGFTKGIAKDVKKPEVVVE